MTAADPGSFRDPASRVVIDDGRVIRLLDERGRAAWEALRSTHFHDQAVSSGDLIASQPIEVDPAWEAAAALEHPPIPLISYPYEWTFTMLKDAALLQLDLLERALRAGLTIKDATPYNIQFVAARPVFIDVGSFEPYRSGEPWLGYRQFTRQFLFPLMMRAWVGVPFQPWLRGDMEGPTANQMRHLLGGRKRFSTAALLHVRLQARLEERAAGTAVRDDLKKAGFSVEMILANVAKLKKLVKALDWDPTPDGWSSYHSAAHVERDRDHKTDFLNQALESVQPKTVLDLGANDGHFSRAAAVSGSHAVAVDSDEAVLDHLYRTTRGEDLSVILTELTDPSPDRGWAGSERPGLLSRVQADLVIAYGLIHHLIYTASVPPVKVVEWLAGFDAPLVLEFVSPDDEMVAVLAANKTDEELHRDRAEPDFRRVLDRWFIVSDETALPGGTRILFHLTPRRDQGTR